MRPAPWLSLLAIAGLVLAACAGGTAAPASPARPAPSGSSAAPASAQSAQPAEKERVKVGYSSTSLTVLATLLAQSQGFYAQQGLDAELVQIAPQASLAAISTGELDYVMSLGSTLRAAAKGLPVRIVEASLQAPQFLLVARPEIRQPTDLRGKIVGVTSLGGTNHQTGQLFAKHFGLDPQRDVQFLGIGEEGTLWEALRLGRVQAVPVAPPFPVLAEREGYPLLANAAELFQMPATGVGASVDKLAKSREQVRRVTAAEIQALRYIRAERDATIAFIAQRFEMEPSIAARSYELVLPSFSPDGRLHREGVELVLELDQAAGALTDIPPLETVADFNLVDEALPLLDRR